MRGLTTVEDVGQWEKNPVTEAVTEAVTDCWPYNPFCGEKMPSVVKAE